MASYAPHEASKKVDAELQHKMKAAPERRSMFGVERDVAACDAQADAIAYCYCLLLLLFCGWVAACHAWGRQASRWVGGVPRSEEMLLPHAITYCHC